MLLLSVLAFLQGAVYVAMGEGMPYPSSNSKNGEVPYPVWNAVQPTIPDKQLSFGISQPNDRSISYKPNGLSFSEWSNQVRKNGRSITKRFALYFIKKVQSSKKLRKAFQVQQFNAESLSDFFYNYTNLAHSAIGNPDAEVAAQFAGLAVGANFNKLKQRRDNMLRTFAEVASNYLLNRGYLNENNVASLSQQYFSVTKKRINSVKKPNPKENMNAVCDAFSDFLTSLGFRNKYSVNMIIGLFANQLYA